MSVRIAVLCQSPEPIPLSEIVEFVEAGVIFDNYQLRYEPPSAPTDGPDWDSVHVHYAEQKRPFIIERVESASLVSIVDEILGQLQQSNGPADLQETIRSTQQGFILEIAPWGAPEEVWQVCSVVEANLCRVLNGLTVSSEGIYDARLNMVFKFRK